jgi:hypothetical protein
MIIKYTIMTSTFNFLRREFPESVTNVGAPIASTLIESINLIDCKDDSHPAIVEVIKEIKKVHCSVKKYRHDRLDKNKTDRNNRHITWFLTQLHLQKSRGEKEEGIFYFTKSKNCLCFYSGSPHGGECRLNEICHLHADRELELEDNEFTLDEQLQEAI